MNCTTDVVIVGAGPAGLAAGIWARVQRLECTVVERDSRLPGKPGETLHPGAGSILRQLGVEEAVAAASGIRHRGVMTTWNSTRGFVLYADDQGHHLGYQVMRETLSAILLARFVELGGEILMGTRADAPLREAGRIGGISTREGDIHAGVTVDASGGSGWLRRFIDTAIEYRSPPLLARYGYARGRLQYAAALQGDRSGWSWTAQVKPELVQWTTMGFSAQRDSTAPEGVPGMEPVGTSRSARVTWRQTRHAAGAGYFVVGDAATMLDPASSHGVLRGLMSGLMAIHCVAAVRGGSAWLSAVRSYNSWLNDWADADMCRLAGLYGELDVDWALAFTAERDAARERVETQ